MHCINCCGLFTFDDSWRRFPRFWLKDLSCPSLFTSDDILDKTTLHVTWRVINGLRVFKADYLLCCKHFIICNTNCIEIRIMEVWKYFRCSVCVTKAQMSRKWCHMFPFKLGVRQKRSLCINSIKKKTNAHSSYNNLFLICWYIITQRY